MHRGGGTSTPGGVAAGVPSAFLSDSRSPGEARRRSLGRRSSPFWHCYSPWMSAPEKQGPVPEQRLQPLQQQHAVFTTACMRMRFGRARTAGFRVAPDHVAVAGVGTLRSVIGSRARSVRRVGESRQILIPITAAVDASPLGSAVQSRSQIRVLAAVTRPTRDITSNQD